MELSVRELDLASATEPIPEDGPDPYRMVQVHDYLNVSFLRMDPTIRAATKEVISTFSMAYPELLKEKFFVNVPLVMGCEYSFLLKNHNFSVFSIFYRGVLPVMTLLPLLLLTMLTLMANRGLRSHQSLPGSRDGQEIPPSELRRESSRRAEGCRDSAAGSVWRQGEGLEEQWADSQIYERGGGES